MKIKNKISTAYICKTKRLLFALLALSFLTGYVVYAQSTDQSITQIGTATDQAAIDKQAKIDELERKAKIYQQIIDIKRQQGATLNNQISIMDTSLQQTQQQIQTTEKQISDLNDQISQLERQIGTKNDSINGQKVVLSNLLELYYELVNQEPTVFLLNQEGIASSFSSKDQVSQIGDKVKGLIDTLTNMRNDLQNQNAQVSSKKNELVDLHNNLKDQTDNMQTVKDQKQTLLDQTKGEEANYQQLLAKVEQQKQELMDIDQFFASSGISIDSYPKPPISLYASTSWYYSQKDPAWGDNMIGASNASMKKYGCAVTSVAMVLTEHGYSTNPGTLAKQPMYTRDGLISWPTSWPSTKLTMSSDGMSHGNINWSTIDSQLAKGNPVIVHINKSNGAGGHYVVIHHKELLTGKYVVHDPYFGSNLYLDTSRAIMGAIDGSSATSIDQMIIYK